MATSEAGDGTTEDNWGSRTGFILAAAGSAIGLGNIWRFPYVAYENGGGAFLLPYLFALLTAGLPLLVLEYAIGHRFRGSAPLSFRRLDRRAEWLGWWQVAVGFVIASYYAVVLAWAGAYTWFSVTLAWGDDPEAFFTGDYLRTPAAPGPVGGLVPGVAVPLLLVWIAVVGIAIAGVKRGIERAVKVMLPVLIVAFVIIVARAVTLEGAGQGLDALFAPDFSRLTDSSVWIAAYGQIFFSLSIAFAIMVTYSSYLPRRSDLTNNAFIAGLANSSFELLAGIGVFAALGFMATRQGVAVGEVATEGVGLAFIAFPRIISELPALNALFGVLFFGSLVLAGVSSLISIFEVLVAALRDKLAMARRPVVLIGGGALATVSFVYATEGGLYVLDSADSFINSFGVALTGLAEVVLIAWVLRRLGEMQEHANAVSDVPLGMWWRISLAVITPLVLGWQAIDNLVTNLTSNYEDYPTAFLVATGWSVALLALVVGVVVGLTGWRGHDLQIEHAPDEPRTRSRT
jgi:NSS family neurotransmitter:Na+ symporter